MKKRQPIPAGILIAVLAAALVLAGCGILDIPGRPQVPDSPPAPGTPVGGEPGKEVPGEPVEDESPDPCPDLPSNGDVEIPGGGEGGGGEPPETGQSEEEKLAERDPEDLDIEENIRLYSFLSSPIQGGRVTSVNGQLPNAPRSYRNGVHEGLDYYEVKRGTPVLAAAEGTVIRADHDYVEMTLEEYDEVIRISKEKEITPEELLDKLRGMQVWIQHRHDIVTRYAHLDTISPDLSVGDRVEKGQVVGTVGDSGIRSGVVGKTLSASGAPHLHFEIWRKGRFLGQGMTPDQVRHIYTEVLKE